MSRRSPLTVRAVFYNKDAGILGQRIETLLEGEVASSRNFEFDTFDPGAKATLIKMGWTPPQPPVAASDEIEIGRRLDVIRAENPRVNLSWIEADKILIGGVVNSKELRALAALMESVK